MLRTVSSLTFGLLILTGCPGDDTGTTNGGTAGSGTGAGTGTTESNPPGTTAGDTADTSVNPDTTVSPESTDGPGTTEGPGETTESPGTSGDSGTTAGVDDCAACVEAECPEELAECMMDADCTCFQECAAMGPGGVAGALACAGECMIPVIELMSGDTAVGALATCTQDNCPVCLE